MGIYRFPQEFRRSFLYAIPVYAFLVVCVGAVAMLSNLQDITAFGCIVILMPLVVMFFAWLYAKHYRVEIFDSVLTIVTLFQRKSIDLHHVRKIVLWHNKYTYLWLLDSNDIILTKINALTQDFEAMQSEIVECTRSCHVTRYRNYGLYDWEEKTNLQGSAWGASNGPGKPRLLGKLHQIALVLCALAFFLAVFIQSR